MKKALLTLKIIWGVFSLFLLIVYIADLIHIYSKPGDYPIGWEGGGWVYESTSNYKFFGYIQVFWCLIGFTPIIFFKRRISNYILGGHSSISLFSILSYWYELIRG